jgi:alkylated DNA repair dioxygenase AlkB
MHHDHDDAMRPVASLSMGGDRLGRLRNSMDATTRASDRFEPESSGSEFFRG